MESFTPALQSVFKDQRPGQPWVESDFKAIYRSAENWKTDLVAGDLEGGWLPEGWQAGAETPLVGPPERWWVPGFLPVGELTMVYGRGGAGKSTFASWLASEVSRAGGKIGVWGVEEPFRRFLRRAVLGGAVRENIFGNDHASTLELPRDAQAVASQARFLGLDVLYFDSIASHMDAASGLNIAERTRRSLAPLAELAQTEGFTVVCVFHENKAGEFGGSVEMLNVARHVLHLTRRGRGPLRVRVKKTNLEEPDFLLQFEADDLNIVDPQTGEVQMRVVDGEEQAATTKVLRAIDPLSLEAVEAEEEGTALVDVDRPLRGEALKTALRELLAASPGMHWQEAAQALNVNPQTVKRYIAECRPPAVGE
jgi:RecA/RadA recombinase